MWHNENTFSTLTLIIVYIIWLSSLYRGSMSTNMEPSTVRARERWSQNLEMISFTLVNTLFPSLPGGLASVSNMSERFVHLSGLSAWHDPATSAGGVGGAGSWKSTHIHSAQIKLCAISAASVNSSWFLLGWVYLITLWIRSRVSMRWYGSTEHSKLSTLSCILNIGWVSYCGKGFGLFNRNKNTVLSLLSSNSFPKSSSHFEAWSFSSIFTLT